MQYRAVLARHRRVEFADNVSQRFDDVPVSNMLGDGLGVGWLGVGRINSLDLGGDLKIELDVIPGLDLRPGLDVIPELDLRPGLDFIPGLDVCLRFDGWRDDFRFHFEVDVDICRISGIGIGTDHVISQSLRNDLYIVNLNFLFHFGDSGRWCCFVWSLKDKRQRHRDCLGQTIHRWPFNRAADWHERSRRQRWQHAWPGLFDNDGNLHCDGGHLRTHRRARRRLPWTRFQPVWFVGAGALGGLDR